VSIEQRETLDAILRQSAFPVGSDVNEQRQALYPILDEAAAALDRAGQFLSAHLAG
jgi:hypothetical protein